MEGLIELDGTSQTYLNKFECSRNTTKSIQCPYFHTNSNLCYVHRKMYPQTHPPRLSRQYCQPIGKRVHIHYLKTMHMSTTQRHYLLHPLPSHLKNNHGMDNRITDAMQIRVDTLYVSIYDLKYIHFPTKETIMTSKPKTRSHCGH